MAHIHRLIFAALLTFFCFGASAAIPALPRYCDPGNHCGSVSDVLSYWQSANPTNACSGGVTVPVTWYSVNVTDSGFTLGKRASQACPGFSNVYDAWQFAANRNGSICPENSSNLVGTSCTCNDYFDEVGGTCVRQDPCKRAHPEGGWHEEGGTCVKDTCGPTETRVNGVCVPEPPCDPGYTRVNGECKKDDSCANQKGKSAGFYDVVDGETSYWCEAGCTIKVSATTCVRYEGKESCAGEAFFTGASCKGGNNSSPPNPPKPPASTPDPPNPPASNPNPPNPPASTPGSGGGTGGGGGGGGNGGGGGGGSNNNGGNTGGNNNGGSTSSPNPSNGLPVPKPVPTDNDGKCQPGTHQVSSNPTVCIKDPVPPNNDGKCDADSVKINGKCVYTEPPSNNGNGGGTAGGGNGKGDGSSWGGDCKAGFSCDGDAIQCAISYEQHMRNCTLFENASEESNLYGAEKGKTGSQTGSLPGNETKGIGSGDIDTSNALGLGGCIQDLNVTIAGSAVALPISRICPYLEQMGSILVAVAFLIAIKIIGRG